MLEVLKHKRESGLRLTGGRASRAAGVEKAKVLGWDPVLSGKKVLKEALRLEQSEGNRRMPGNKVHKVKKRAIVWTKRNVQAYMLPYLICDHQGTSAETGLVHVWVTAPHAQSVPSAQRPGNVRR